MEKETFTNAKVVNLAKRFVPVMVDTDKNKDAKSLLKKYKIEGIPTVLFLNAKGDVLEQIVGYLPPKDFLEKMNGVLKKKSK